MSKKPSRLTEMSGEKFRILEVLMADEKALSSESIQSHYQNLKVGLAKIPLSKVELLLTEMVQEQPIIEQNGHYRTHPEIKELEFTAQEESE